MSSFNFWELSKQQFDFIFVNRKVTNVGDERIVGISIVTHPLFYISGTTVSVRLSLSADQYYIQKLDCN